ncbi:hypothetical protein ASC97_06990 [Rhizobium sp. Root1203]|uniref:hypothetical protein n=1 Tax=Rhizobium sp. Root1203 TaxID=1736427 RepID=UPI00070F3B3B|nr:hypothetical protein [Rhizobium sp. Root1203]KQV28087.1 hypothetical protein ASC97_06990 [Rhizobium sp. Root1203]
MPYAKNDMVSTDEIEGGIQITEAQYAEALAGMISGKLIKIDGGFAVVDPEPEEEEEEPPEPTFEQSKANYKANIDGLAEFERSKYITLGSGQAMTYMQKASEAKAWIAAAMAGTPMDSDYPLILAEVGITAPTLGEVAMVVNTAFTQWQQIGAAIESVRLSAKAEVEAAGTVEGMKAILDALTWP